MENATSSSGFWLDSDLWPKQAPASLALFDSWQLRYRRQLPEALKSLYRMRNGGHVLNNHFSWKGKSFTFESLRSICDDDSAWYALRPPRKEELSKELRQKLKKYKLENLAILECDGEELLALHWKLSLSEEPEVISVDFMGTVTAGSFQNFLDHLSRDPSDAIEEEPASWLDGSLHQIEIEDLAAFQGVKHFDIQGTDVLGGIHEAMEAEAGKILGAGGFPKLSADMDEKDLDKAMDDMDSMIEGLMMGMSKASRKPKKKGLNSKSYFDLMVKGNGISSIGIPEALVVSTFLESQGVKNRILGNPGLTLSDVFGAKAKAANLMKKVVETRLLNQANFERSQSFKKNSGRANQVDESRDALFLAGIVGSTLYQEMPAPQGAGFRERTPFSPGEKLDRAPFPPLILRRLGRNWEGSLTLPAWKGFQSIEEDAPSNGELRLVISAGPGHYPSVAQEAALRLHLEHGEELRDLVLKALYQHYDQHERQHAEEMLEWMDDEDQVEITSPESLRKAISPGSLHILAAEHQGQAILGIGFGCNWDMEHGAGIRLAGREVLEVGQSDVSFRD